MFLVYSKSYRVTLNGLLISFNFIAFAVFHFFTHRRQFFVFLLKRRSKLMTLVNGATSMSKNGGRGGESEKLGDKDSEIHQFLVAEIPR